MKITKKLTKQETIWRDFHWVQIVTIVLSTFWLLFLSITFSDLLSLRTIPLLMIFPGGVLLLFLYLVVAALITKLTYVTNKGIRVGNAPNDMYSTIWLKKTVFLRWDEIKSIHIVNHEVRRGITSMVRPFLKVTSTDRRAYTCFIARPKSFMQAIQRLKKTHLVAQGSKYATSDKKPETRTTKASS